MKKVGLSSFVVISFLFYAVLQNSTTGKNSFENPIIAPAGQSPPGGASSQPLPRRQAGITPNLLTYHDGEYIGTVTDAFYGNEQVKAVIQNGKIVDIQFLQYPNDRPESTQINSEANPILKQEAIQVQNAQVDIVTGATQSSEAFRQSLQNALEKARN